MSTDVNDAYKCISGMVNRWLIVGESWLIVTKQVQVVYVEVINNCSRSRNVYNNASCAKHRLFINFHYRRKVPQNSDTRRQKWLGQNF